MQKEAKNNSAAIPAGSHPRDGVDGTDPRRVRLSYGQKRIWFIERMLPGRETFIVPSVWRIRGPLQVGRLEAAIQSIVSRHDVLRTRYPVPTLPVGEVVEFRPQLSIIDLTDVGADQLAARTHGIVRELLCRPFQFATEPPVRMNLIRESDNEHILVFCVHHIACDAWGRAVFHHELTQTYNLLCRGEAGLPQPETQISAYADWQAEHEDDWNDGLTYWRDQLDGAERFSIPLDFPRPETPSGRFGVASVALDTETSTKLAEAAKSQRSTQFMLLLSAFFALMHRHTGLQDLVVGSPMVERSRPELEWLIGFLLNNLPIRAQVTPETTFAELSTAMRATTLNAFLHHEVPFEKIVEVVRENRGGSSAPLFNVLFNMHANLRDPDLELDELICSRYPLQHSGANFDCTLYVHAEHDDSLRCDLVYDADLYTQAHIDELARQYGSLVVALLDTPDASIGSVSLNTNVGSVPKHASSGSYQIAHASSRQHVSDGASNRAQTEDSHDDVRAAVELSDQFRIENRIREHCVTNAQQVALSSNAESITYGELWDRAEVVSATLRTAGVRSGDVVALLATRGEAVPVGMLAILLADATILMLDASDPAERLNELIISAGARCILPTRSVASDSSLAGCVDSDDVLILASVDAIVNRTLANRTPGGLSAVEVPAANRRHNKQAYVSFTSGTTGKPRKVFGSHVTLTTPLNWRQAEFELGSSDRQAFLSSLTSDACFRDTLLALSFGMTICIPDAERFLHPGYLPDWLSEEKCSVANLTPALLPLLLKKAAKPNLHLRVVFLVGDVLQRTAARELGQWATSARLINYYGTTETGQALAWFDVANDDGAGAFIPIGKGEFDTRLLVRSNSGVVCAPFERGEIVFRSSYLGAVESTSRPTPGPQEAYSTGDIGYVDSQGVLRFVGRSDRQTKVRGYRVDLHEIEYSLRLHPDAMDAIVVVANIAGEDVLLAHFHCPAESELDTDEIVDRIGSLAKRLLPSYMQPAAYVRHAEPWPTNKNGKPDFTKLSDPNLWAIERLRSSLSIAQTILPANTTSELSNDDRIILDRICHIFEDLLCIPVNPDDDFFSLGGHSLLAVELFGRLSKELDLELPLSILFSRPTPRGIYLYARKREEQSRPTRESGLLVTLRTEGTLPPLFLIHGAGGQVLTFEGLSRHLAPGRKLVGLQAKGTDGVSEPHDTIESMARDYWRAIDEMHPDGIVHIAGYSGGGIIALEIARLISAEGRLGCTFLLDTYCPFAEETENNSSNSSWTRRRQQLDAFLRLGPRYVVEWMKERRAFVDRKRKRREYEELADLGEHIPHDLREFGLIKAFRAALEGFTMKPVTFPVILVSSEEERVAHSEWFRWMKGDFEIHTVAGTHSNFILEPSVAAVASVVDTKLAEHEHQRAT